MAKVSTCKEKHYYFRSIKEGYQELNIKFIINRLKEANVLDLTVTNGTIC